MGGSRCEVCCSGPRRVLRFFRVRQVCWGTWSIPAIARCAESVADGVCALGVATRWESICGIAVVAAARGRGLTWMPTGWLGAGIAGGGCCHSRESSDWACTRDCCGWHASGASRGWPGRWSGPWASGSMSVVARRCRGWVSTWWCRCLSTGPNGSHSRTTRRKRWRRYWVAACVCRWAGIYSARCVGRPTSRACRPSAAERISEMRFASGDAASWMGFTCCWLTTS